MEKKLLRTIHAWLKAPESVLEILWKYSVTYTLLINKLFQQIPQEPNFPKWQAEGEVEKAAVDRLIAPWKKQGAFAGMPQRWYASAGHLVTDCYKAWFAQQSKTILSLKGSQRWLAALLLYSEYMPLHKFSESQLLDTAQQVLNAARQEVLEATESRPGTDPKRSLFNTLLQHHETTSSALTQCAIVYLIQRQYEVGEPMLEPDELQKAIAIKQKEIENLEQQLKAQYPKGRDPLGDRFEAEINAAIAGPVLSGGPEAYQADLERWLIRRQIDPRLKTPPDLQFEGDAEVDQRELEKWSEQRQIRLFEETPYPLMFRTGTDLHWSKEPVVRQARSVGTSQSESLPEPVPSTRPKKRRSKRQKRRRVPQERICVSFHSMRKYQFQLFCGHRQLGSNSHYDF
ncbi:type V CRISPR-associated protein Cas12k [Leptolyngbya sp. AN03gr2]|uniref:type V CRISPR-associated protein Cas12k n=1 Tax=unclassified Leptolyngbya TaxID=2650499 RepID=UPI003D31AC86